MKKEVLEHNSKMVDVLLKELEEHEKENNKDANLDEKKKATKEFRKQMGEISMQKLKNRDSVIIDPKVEKNKIERNLNMKRIYRIDHVYFHDSNSSCLLIESDLEPIALAKIIVAIIFKFEELVKV
ncbi:MAG: hypothetical protein MJH09_12530 [Cetobacterium sp.]|nr:hypothetical protein [Cetobacterium sp.]